MLCLVTISTGVDIVPNARQRETWAQDQPSRAILLGQHQLFRIGISSPAY